MSSSGFQASSQADVVLALGAKFGFSLAHGRSPAWSKSQKMIQVDIDPTIIGRAKSITVGVEGDCKMFLSQILEEVKKSNRIQNRKWPLNQKNCPCLIL